MEELKLQWLRRLETAFLGKDEEVKKGYFHPSGAEVPWSDCMGEAMHMLSKLCLLLRNARPVSSDCWVSSSCTLWKEMGGKRKKSKMFSLFI